MHPPPFHGGVDPPKLAGMLLGSLHCVCRVWAGIEPAHPRPPRYGRGRGALATIAAAALLPPLPLHAALRAALLLGRALRALPPIVACAPCRLPRSLLPRCCSPSAARTATPASFAPPGTPSRLVACAPPRPQLKRQPPSHRLAFARLRSLGCSGFAEALALLRSPAFACPLVFHSRPHSVCGANTPHC